MIFDNHLRPKKQLELKEKCFYVLFLHIEDKKEKENSEKN